MGEGVGNGGPVAITLCTIDGDRPTWRAIARMVNPDACSARIIALRSPLAHAANHRTPQTLSAVVHPRERGSHQGLSHAVCSRTREKRCGMVGGGFQDLLSCDSDAAQTLGHSHANAAVAPAHMA